VHEKGPEKKNIPPEALLKDDSGPPKASGTPDGRFLSPNEERHQGADASMHASALCERQGSLAESLRRRAREGGGGAPVKIHWISVDGMVKHLVTLCNRLL
jgi:hypothetical protein